MLKTCLLGVLEKRVNKPRIRL